MPCKPLHCIYGNVIIPQRWVLAIVLHLAMLNAYNLRVSLNIAITEMVIPKKKDNKTFDDCPNLVPIKGKPPKDGQYNWDADDQAKIKYSFFVGYFFGHFPGGWLGDKIGARHVTGTCLLLAAVINFILPILIQKGGEYWGFIWCIVIRSCIGLFQTVKGTLFSVNLIQSCSPVLTPFGHHQCGCIESRIQFTESILPL